MTYELHRTTVFCIFHNWQCLRQDSFIMCFIVIFTDWLVVCWVTWYNQLLRNNTKFCLEGNSFSSAKIQRTSTRVITEFFCFFFVFVFKFLLSLVLCLVLYPTLFVLLSIVCHFIRITTSVHLHTFLKINIAINPTNWKGQYNWIQTTSKYGKRIYYTKKVHLNAFLLY